MRFPKSRAVLALPMAFSLLVVSACGGEDAEQTREPAVRPVKLITLSPASDVQTARYPAVISAGQSADLSFQVNGFVAEMAVSDAQSVNQGDLIARLDQRDFQNQLTTARAQFETAEEEYQRAVRLAAEDAIARSVLEQRESQRDVARAQLDSAEKALEDTVLRAPFSGVVTQAPANNGDAMSAGQLVASLMGAGILKATIDLPARVIAQSQEVEDRGAVVLLDAAPNERMEATFLEAVLVADAASQTYEVVFTFEPPENLVVLPGMNATVELSSARRAESSEIVRISVPLSAIASDGENTYVWVVDQDTMIVSRRDVTVADGIGETAVVTEGLALGETIATAGASYLADGMQVRPWSE